MTESMPAPVLNDGGDWWMLIEVGYTDNPDPRAELLQSAAMGTHSRHAWRTDDGRLAGRLPPASSI